MVSLQFTQVPYPGRNRWKSPGNPNRFVAEIMGGLGRYFWSKMTVPPAWKYHPEANQFYSTCFNPFVG